jgi:O-antigen ligase
MSTAPRNKWVLPAFTVFLGIMVFSAQWIGGHLSDGLWSLALLCAVALVLLVGGRSETIDLVRQPDERWRALDMRASAFTGIVIVCVLIGAWLWELAHGRDGSPYGQLCAVSGLVYVAMMVWLRFRG